MKPFRWAAVLVCLPVTAVAQGALPSADSLKALIRPWIASETAAGMVVGMVSGGSTRIAALGRVGAAGTAVPSDSTTFEIGSVSKVFTAVLLADMVSRGEVKLDDSVQRYLPPSVHVPEGGTAITLGDLASHMSGLPRDPDNMKRVNSGDPFSGYGPGDLYAFLSSYALDRDPEEGYEYSNLGMALLGHALELKAGKSYEALVTERILAPLGMRDTYITTDRARTAREAIGHNPDLEPTASWRGSAGVLLGGGTWRSSVRDMLRFARAAAERADTPLGRAFTLAMTPAWEAEEPGDSIGLGWNVLDQNGLRITWHNGDTDGFASMLAVDAKGGRGVVILSNTSMDADVIAYRLLDPKVLFNPPVLRRTVTIPIAAMDRCVGVYEFASGSHARVFREGEKLFFEPENVPRMRLNAESETRFFLRIGRDVEFVRGPAGPATELVVRAGGQEARAKRVDR